jgi:hypothetical protein
MSPTLNGIARWGLVLAWLPCACGQSPPALPAGSTASAVAVDSLTQAGRATLEPGALATVSVDTVIRWSGPGQRRFEVARRSSALESGHARRFGNITLPITLRSGSADVSQYPCGSCHQGRRVVMEKQRITDAHHNIQPVHPDQTGALCSTCHASDNVALLSLASGERATLDESYRLCGECHFAQADAWAGGGHGKRLDGWQGRRVVMACTDCHDPHRPAVQPRIPFRAPIIARTRSHDP